MSKTKKIILLCVISAFLSLSFVIPASALDSSANYYYVTSPISQPQCTENSCYIEIVCQDINTWQRYGYVFLISFSNTSNRPACGITFIRNGANNCSIKFTNISDGVMQYVRITEGGGVYTSSAIAMEQSLTEPNYTNIVSAKVYGCSFVSPQSSNVNTVPFITVYGSDRKSIELLESIQSLICGLGNINANQDKNANNIINSQNSNAQQIQQNQNQNTDKITNNNDANTDKIIQNQQEIHQNEIDETNKNGNGSSSAVQNAIEDKSAGFTSSLNNFVRGMSTSDTACKISMPAISIPELQGLIPASVLSAESEVDFSQAVGLMPESIIKLVQALTTIALIIFCFKELYDTIEYGLTLGKGGGDS